MGKEVIRMEYVLRPATVDDFDFMFALKKANFKQYVEKIWGWEDDFQKEWLRKDLSQQPIRKQIIVVDGNVAGVYEAQMADEGDYHINEISLPPEYQDKGIGTALLTAVLRENKQRGVKTMLQVFKDNKAKQLYERLGFTVSGETKTHYQMELEPKR